MAMASAGADLEALLAAWRSLEATELLPERLVSWREEDECPRARLAAISILFSSLLMVCCSIQNCWLACVSRPLESAFMSFSVLPCKWSLSCSPSGQECKQRLRLATAKALFLQ